MEFKNNIQDLYFKAFEIKPDNKMSTYWTNSISNGEKSEADFVKFIINGNEYKSRVLSKFKSIWCEIIGTEFDDNIVKCFLEKSESVVGSLEIKKFLKNTDVYLQKIRNIIITMFNSRFNKEPTNDEIIYYISKFQENENYTIAAFEHDIQYSNKDIVQDFCSKNNIGKSSEIYDEYVKLKNDDTYLLKLITSPATTNNIELDNSFIDNFEKVFDRPIYVQEYSMYYNDRKSSDMTSLYTNHVERFKTMKTILFKYTNYDLKEHEYVRKFLFNIEKPGFVENFEKHIVYDEKYVAMMKDNITSIYQQLYDEQLDAADIEYIFDKVQTQRLDIQDQRLDDHLLEFKNETDNIVHRIFKLYMEIYERTPDKLELLEKSFRYRRQASFDDIDRVIEKELMMCLEFHDIIKKRIRKINQDMNVSEVYKLLSQVISNLNSLTMDMLDGYIAKSL
jgi:hypothetical protein